jgi:hypothetical protein
MLYKVRIGLVLDGGGDSFDTVSVIATVLAATAPSPSFVLQNIVCIIFT